MRVRPVRPSRHLYLLIETHGGERGADAARERTETTGDSRGLAEPPALARPRELERARTPRRHLLRAGPGGFSGGGFRRRHCLLRGRKLAFEPGFLLEYQFRCSPVRDSSPRSCSTREAFPDPACRNYSRELLLVERALARFSSASRALALPRAGSDAGVCFRARARHDGAPRPRRRQPTRPLRTSDRDAAHQ